MQSSRFAHFLHKLRNVSILASLIVLAFASLLDASALPREPGRVTKVVDGDTLVIQLDSGRSEHVRLIGIDTPESKLNHRTSLQAKKTNSDEETIVALGHEAHQNTSRLAPVGTRVELEYDIQPRDKYKRILAYVYLPDGAMLNEAIVSSGYASLLTIPPNVRYSERFQKALIESRAAGRGLWSKAHPW